MSKRRAAFLTLGCKVNQYETDAMEEILEKAGYEIVSFKETADVYIINTCSVTNMADRKSRQMIHRAKKNNPDANTDSLPCLPARASWAHSSYGRCTSSRSSMFPLS